MENDGGNKNSRGKHLTGERIFTAECTVFGLLAVFFMLCCLRVIVLSARAISVIYLLYAVLIVAYHILLNTVWRKADGACHSRMYRKQMPAQDMHEKAAAAVKRQRKGSWKVAILYFIYLLVLAGFRINGLITPELFLLGASVMFLLNSVFIHRFCLLRALFLRNVRCCAFCGIAGWDYFIFGSALLFAPELPVLTVWGYGINGIIFICCLIYTVVWEYNIRKFPARFVPAVNEALACGRCEKKCTRCGERHRTLKKTALF